MFDHTNMFGYEGKGTPGIHQFEEPKNITDLGVIRDATNPMARQARRGPEMIVEIYKEQTEIVEVVATNDTMGRGI